jgi:predicted DNA-binding transcriptional regulator AlpA
MVQGHERILYTVSDISSMLGISDSAVRMHVFRKTAFLPEPLRIGTKRLVWTREQLEAHFRSLTPPPAPPPPTKKLGRPTKRDSLKKTTQPIP